MITFTRLGSYGRLGNQLFQIAATVGAAIKNEDVYAFPRWPYEGRLNISGCFYDDLDTRGLDLYQEPSFRYTPIPQRPGLDLAGYFQSEKYFAHCKDFIRNLFKTGESTTDACFMHVRRGDYLTKPECHPVQTMEYFRSAMAVMRSDRYLVFSDDLAWCREHFLGRQFEFSEGRDAIEDLLLMSSCSGAIISNSSFSWWGAWLAGHNNVICPSRWFGPEISAFNQTEDLLPEAWMVI